MLAELHDLLKKHSITAPVEWNTAKPTREGSTWFVGKSWSMNGKDFYWCTFGDFKKGTKYEWKSTGDYTPEEESVAKEHIEATVQIEKNEREKIQLDQAIKLASEWDAFLTTGSTPYMARKQINQLFSARIKPNDKGDPILIVPMRDVDNKFWNYQRIYSQKLSKGDKFFSEGAKIEGCFHALSELDGTKEILVGEGFATMASIQMALGNQVVAVAAFNAQNLQPVATALREKYPSTRIIICADNDAYTVFKGKPYNVGLEKGRRAAGAIRADIRYPVFKYPQKGLTDFNDLHCAEGLELVKDQIEHFEKYVQGIQPMCLQTSKNGKTLPPSEKELSDYMLANIGDRLLKQERDLFRYNGSHWEELTMEKIDEIKQKIQIAANGLLGFREIENYFRYFLMHCPSVPPNTMYQPNPWASNFRDGTMHFWRDKDLSYKIEFKQHSPHDHLVTTLPFDAPKWRPGEVLPPAPMFDDMVAKLWANNEDREEVRLLAHELVGACLLPLFPVIALFVGKPNSGKSTFIKLLVKLVSFQNVSSVQPCDMHGFNMESMIGKLVNFDTDIDVNKPMQDAEIKKLIDRMPRRIRRKGRIDATGFLPAVHLFAANKLPRTLDGSSSAYSRRMIITKTDSFQVPERSVYDFEQKILDEEIEGIVARGLEGIHRLIANEGKYTTPKSSGEHVRSLERENDIVAQFVEDARHNEVTDRNNKVLVSDEQEIENTKLWEIFKAWQENSVPRPNQVGKIQFFTNLEAKGFERHRYPNRRVFKGIGLLASESGVN